MENKTENNTEKAVFAYTYSAKERKEVEEIRQKYTLGEKGEESGLERLRKLDSAVTKKATAWALVLGIFGALILGTGMSLIMTDLGKNLGVWAIVLGGAVGVIGMAICAVSYPVYTWILKRGRAKIAPEVLRLTDELLQ